MKNILIILVLLLSISSFSQSSCPCTQNIRYTSKAWINKDNSLIDSASKNFHFSTMLQCGKEYMFFSPRDISYADCIGNPPVCNCKRNMYILDQNYNQILFVPHANYNSFVFTQAGNYTVKYVFKINDVTCWEYSYTLGVDCPEPQDTCCQNPFSIDQVGVVETFPSNDGSFTLGVLNFKAAGANVIPISEMGFNVESFSTLNKNLDCKPCNNSPVSLGTILSIGNFGTGANSLALRNYNLNNSDVPFFTLNEVVWENSNGVIINQNDPFSLFFILPPQNNLTCCLDTARICFRFYFKDVNCNYCEGSLCLDMPLKKLVMPGQGKDHAAMQKPSSKISEILNKNISDVKQFIISDKNKSSIRSSNNN